MKNLLRKSCFLIFAISILLCAMSGCATENSPNSKNESNITEQSDSEKVETDSEILMREGHPKWLDNIDQVYDTWQDEIDSGKVVLPDTWETIYGDDHILELSSYSTDYLSDEGVEYIGAITFHFSNFDEIVSLDEALKIISTYLPKETIQKYYNEERSYYEVSDGIINTYIKSYRLINEEDSDLERLDTTFDILIWVDENGNVTDAEIYDVAFSKFDEEIMRDWNYDFFAEN